MQLFAEMQQKGLQPDLITYSTVISACGNGGDAERALQLFVEMQQKGLQPDVITYTAVISACGKGLLAKSALQVLEDAAEGFRPNLTTYTAVINDCGKGGDAERWPCNSLQRCSRRDSSPI